MADNIRQVQKIYLKDELDKIMEIKKSEMAREKQKKNDEYLERMARERAAEEASIQEKQNKLRQQEVLSKNYSESINRKLNEKMIEKIESRQFQETPLWWSQNFERQYDESVKKKKEMIKNMYESEKKRLEVKNRFDQTYTNSIQSDEKKLVAGDYDPFLRNQLQMRDSLNKRINLIEKKEKFYDENVNALQLQRNNEFQMKIDNNAKQAQYKAEQQEMLKKEKQIRAQKQLFDILGNQVSYKQNFQNQEEGDSVIGENGLVPGFNSGFCIKQKMQPVYDVAKSVIVGQRDEVFSKKKQLQNSMGFIDNLETPLFYNNGNFVNPYVHKELTKKQYIPEVVNQYTR